MGSVSWYGMGNEAGAHLFVVGGEGGGQHGQRVLVGDEPLLHLLWGEAGGAWPAGVHQARVDGKYLQAMANGQAILQLLPSYWTSARALILPKCITCWKRVSSLFILKCAW